MKKTCISLVLTCALLMSGCSWLSEDYPDDATNEGIVEAGDRSVGTGLEEIKITALQDPDPDRQIVRRTTPVRQIRGIDINGNSLSDDFYFYRSLLSGTYKQAYDQIYASLYNGNQQVSLSVSVQSDDIADIVYSVYYDHPELFWVDSSLTYYMNGSGIVTSLIVNFNGTANSLKTSQQRFESAIAPLINYASTLSNDAQKAKYVHDYLTNTIDYVSGAEYNQSAYSAIVNGKTVCAGYAHAFQYCMQKLGIPAAYIVGYAGENHAWNILRLDGEYYAMDVTWDDPLNNPATTYYYDYFNITDAQISKDHTRDSISAKLPTANGTKYSFNSYFGSGAYGSDFSVLNNNTSMPSDYNNTSSLPSSSSEPAQSTTPSFSEPTSSQPTLPDPTPSSTPISSIPTPSNPTPSYPEPSYQQPSDDYNYIDNWTDADWDNYWNDFDNWLSDNNLGSVDYNYSDWENYYFGDSCDYNDYDYYNYDNWDNYSDWDNCNDYDDYFDDYWYYW